MLHLLTRFTTVVTSLQRDCLWLWCFSCLAVGQVPPIIPLRELLMQRFLSATSLAANAAVALCMVMSFFPLSLEVLT